MAHSFPHAPSFNSRQSLAPNYLCLAHLEGSLRMQLIGRSQDWLREEFVSDGHIHMCVTGTEGRTMMENLGD